MATERFPVSGADDVRMILSQHAEPMTVGEILASCRIYRCTTQIACALAIDGHIGLVDRQGTRGSYRYCLTAEGHTAVANPNAMRGRARRRVRGHRHIDVANITEVYRHG